MMPSARRTAPRRKRVPNGVLTMVCAGGCRVVGRGEWDGGGEAQREAEAGTGEVWRLGGPLSGSPHTAGRETGRDAAAQVEAVASRTADAKAGAGTERGRGAVDNSRADQASVEGKRSPEASEGGRGRGGRGEVG